jgi:hypothetical protein
MLFLSATKTPFFVSIMLSDPCTHSYSARIASLGATLPDTGLLGSGLVGFFGNFLQAFF